MKCTTSKVVGLYPRRILFLIKLQDSCTFSKFAGFTTKKMRFFIKVFFSKCDQIRSFLKKSHLLKKFIMENFTFLQCLHLRRRSFLIKIQDLSFIKVAGFYLLRLILSNIPRFLALVKLLAPTCKRVPNICRFLL